MSNSPTGVRNLIKFRDARLQAESSRNIYSLQGFEALMDAVALQVCHLLIVVWNCKPGSPHCQAAWAILRIRSRARYVFSGSPLVTVLVDHSWPLMTACMNSSVTRTLLLP